VNLKPSITRALIFVIFLGLTAEIHCQTAFPRLEPDSKALDYYRLGQRSGYSWTELAEISLWASGNSAPSNIERIRAAVTAINNSANFPSGGRDRAEFILTYMHNNILRSYSLYQTKVDVLFTNGNYNCVSSAVLYMILCEALGVNTSGVITREHVFVMVHIDGQNIDVETTNRFGFDPGNKREFHDQFTGVTGFTYVPAQNYRDRQVITKIEVISLILNNRVADFERAGNYRDAVPLAVDRAALLFGPSLAVTSGVVSSGSLFADSRADLLDRLINYGAVFLRSNREDDSLRWAVLASSIYPANNRWQELIMAAVNNRTARLLRENKLQDARGFLDSNRTLLTDADYLQLDAVLIDTELLQRANRISSAEEGDAVILSIEQTRAAGRLSERRAGELQTYAIQKTAAALCTTTPRNWRDAIHYLETSISRFGGNVELEQALRTYRNNLATDYHNRFAAEWNRGNNAEAARILNEGLTEFPNDRQLLADRRIVDRQR
jgi:tetratricopeptide (TPR) repeat protein